MMGKIYYRKKDGVLCNRYPYDIKVDKDCNFIELDENSQEYQNTFTCELNKTWAYLNDRLQVIDYPDLTEQDKQNEINLQIQDCKDYLAETDWISAKINDASVLGEDTTKLLDKYKDTLIKRKQVREEINNLQEKIK